MTLEFLPAILYAIYFGTRFTSVVAALRSTGGAKELESRI